MNPLFPILSVFVKRAEKSTQCQPLALFAWSGTLSFRPWRPSFVGWPRYVWSCPFPDGSDFESPLYVHVIRAPWGEAWDTVDLWGQLEGGPPMRLEYVIPVDGTSATDLAVVAKVLDGKWIGRVEWTRLDDGLVPKRFEMRPASGGPEPMGERVLRRSGLVGVQNAVEQLLTTPLFASTFLGDEWHEPLARPGRRGREDVFYAAWARRYVDALKSSSISPVKRLIDEAAEEGNYLTRHQVTWYVGEARRRGLLSAAPKGRAGGALTDKAVKLLAAYDRVGQMTTEDHGRNRGAGNGER